METKEFKTYRGFREAKEAEVKEEVAVVKSGQSISADLITDCAGWRDALESFFSGLDGYPQLSDWRPLLTAACANGCFEGSGERRGDKWYYSVEDNNGEWYVFLSIEGGENE